MVNIGYHQLFFVFLFDHSPVEVMHGRIFIREIVALDTLASITPSAETQSRDVYTLQYKYM